MLQRLAVLAAPLILAPAGLGQTGTLDQTSPYDLATFNLDASFLVWQQQVRVGVAGQLEGFELKFSQGDAGATANLAIRIGDGWSTTPPVWTGTVTKSVAGVETQFFDVTSANINLAVGDTFVIESFGNDEGVWLSGNYVDPTTGPALYPENLYLGGPGCYSNCGWRHGFRTWMIENGDGNYCQANPNSTGSPAIMSVSGSTSISANNLTLTAQPVPDQPFLFFYGPTQIRVPFGNGFLCAGGGVTRINPPMTAVGNVAQVTPDLIALGITPGVHNFQCWFRDPAGGGSSFNTSDGYRLTLVP